MRYLLINEVCGHTSTGKIVAELAEKIESEGHMVKIAYGRDGYVPDKYKKYTVRIGGDWDVRFHALMTRITDKHGVYSRRSTRRFLKWAEVYNPEVVWLHNLHGYYINYELLFKWIKSRPWMEIKWTLHDCWAFTGHCVHFSVIGCDRWKEHCHNCPQKQEYPRSVLMDNSGLNYDMKVRAFCGIKNLTIYTPSEWLRNHVKNCFLKEYKVEVRRNAVDSKTFKPTESDFRKTHNIEDKIIILGVANIWTKWKRLDVFIELSERLDYNYKIVLVGLSKEQIMNLPGNIIGIGKTNNQEELAGIYTMADVFVNPSLEETFGMTPVESSMCGTPAVVMKGTACEELAVEYDNIYAVSSDIDSIYKKVVELTSVKK